MKQATRGTVPEQTLRHPALYCTPHIKIAGTLVVSPLLVVFDPDLGHPHVREFGAEQYAVHLEASDILECGAIVMPLEEDDVEDGEIAHYLQLRVRTLDGLRFCAKDVESAWWAVFRMQRRDDLYEAARVLLDAAGSRSAEEQPRRQSATSIPFPCLDCMTEMEASTRLQRRRQQQQQQTEQERRLEQDAPLAEGCDHHQRESRPQIPAVKLRTGDGVKTLLTSGLAECLLDYLPIGLRLPGAVEWVLRYTPKAHGVSLSTLFRNLADHDNTVLVIQDAEAHVFGGFASAPWEPCRGRFYGSGEAFVFAFGNLGDAPDVRVYPWTSKNDCFMYSDSDLLAMGGGDGHHAIVVRSDVLHGSSSPTLTFGNPMLSGSEDFVVRDLEVWALEEME